MLWIWNQCFVELTISTKMFQDGVCQTCWQRSPCFGAQSPSTKISPTGMYVGLQMYPTCSLWLPHLITICRVGWWPRWQTCVVCFRALRRFARTFVIGGGCWIQGLLSTWPSKGRCAPTQRYRTSNTCLLDHFASLANNNYLFWLLLVLSMAGVGKNTKQHNKLVH